MSEVNRYVVDCNRLWKGGQLKSEVDVYVVLAADFDRVTAERDALQDLLTAADERADERADDLSNAATKALDVLRSLLKVKACGVHYAAAQMACHQLSTALKSGNP